jgi:hypothetical protein
MTREAIRQRLAAATPGPWEVMRYSHGGGRIYHGHDLVADTYREGDREAIAHAPTDLAALLAVADAAAALMPLLLGMDDDARDGGNPRGEVVVTAQFWNDQIAHRVHGLRYALAALEAADA